MIHLFTEEIKNIMIKHWTVFEGAPNAVKHENLRVTLGTNRTINLNRVAYEALGKPIAVELRFDQNLLRIGLRATSPELPNAFPLRPKSASQQRWIAAGAFLTHFGIDNDVSIAFDKPGIDVDGILILDMKKTTIIGRGSR